MCGIGGYVAASDRSVENLRALGERMCATLAHRGPDDRWQELTAMYAPGANGRPQPLPTEHFGFVDAIGDPV